MAVLYEFLSDEPIENVITCLNFKLDRVVFLGTDRSIKQNGANARRFLENRCGVGQVEFHMIPEFDLGTVLKVLRREMEEVKSGDEQAFYDVTGGGDLVLVAFGMIAREFNVPMHMFDVRGDRLIELTEASNRRISQEIPKRKIQLDLDLYIEMVGGKINYRLHKGMKGDSTEAEQKELDILWRLVVKYSEIWNPFSDFVRKHFLPDDELRVNVKWDTIEKALNSESSGIRGMDELMRIMEDYAQAGLFVDYRNDHQGDNGSRRISFAYKSILIKECLWESGSILELHTYNQLKRSMDDCMVGVHLDWDGVIHHQLGLDVLNEIDVLAIHGNMPIFISCKGGNMQSNKALGALYELKSVTDRFGGRYAEMRLVTLQELPESSRNRAAEMKIRCEVAR